MGMASPGESTSLKHFVAAATAGGMSSNSESTGTGGAAFPSTAWTQVLRVRRGDGAAQQALEDFCRSYWPAIYTCLRALGCPREEALDETQTFLSQFIHGGGLEHVAPERGRLRSYLRQSLRNHIATVRRDAARQKRGGGQIHLSLEDVETFDVPSEPEAADQWFDRRWAWSVVRSAMDRMAARYQTRGKEALFVELKPGLISPDLLKPYAEIAMITGMTEGQVKLEVHRARRRLADELRAEVAATLPPGGDVEEELRYLLSVLSHE
jgi:RNA polymerase sigma-70 factor (ECF subfamily)